MEYADLLEASGAVMRARHILELGPGHNCGSALVLACLGAQVSVADRFPAPWDSEYHPSFYTRLRDQIRLAGQAIDVTPLDNVISSGSLSASIQVFPTSAEDLTGIGPETVDTIVSNAVLEHSMDPRRVAQRLFEVTKLGGIGLHQVDFRDHRDFSRPLEYLLMPEDDFEGMFLSRHGECGRQIRPHEFAALFSGAGFDVRRFDVNWLAESAYLDEFIPRLRASDSRYRHMEREALVPISGRFELRRT